MELESSRLLPADREAVWKALNDPERLQAAIPGCESLRAEGDDRYAIAVVAAIGPVKARFQGRLAVSDAVPPESYTLTFEAQGGPAGFGKGTSHVQLAEEEGGTRLTYRVSAQVGGRIAQVGSRLIDAGARKLADDFFAAFAASFGPAPAVETAAAPAATPGLTPRAWIAIALAIAALAAIVLWIGR